MAIRLIRLMMVDTSLLKLGDAVDRNFERWPILGEYVWPNDFIGQTHSEEIDFLTNWINNRLTWMNEQWGGLCETVSNELSVIDTEPGISIYPNPGNFASTKISINLKKPADDLSTVIFDAAGRIIDKFTVSDQGEGRMEITLPDYSHLPNGIYIIRVRDENSSLALLKYIKK